MIAICFNRARLSKPTANFHPSESKLNASYRSYPPASAWAVENVSQRLPW